MKARGSSLTSAQLATILTDPVGSGGGFVRANAPVFTGVVEMDQPANAASTLLLKRFTDSSPTGMLLEGRTASGFGTFFSVDVLGNISCGTIDSGRLTMDGFAAPNTSTDGVVLTNSNQATSGNQRYSSRLRLTGQGWKTNATAGSQLVDAIIELRPVQGAANPTPLLAFATQVAAGGYTDQLTLSNLAGQTFLDSYSLAAPAQFRGVRANGSGSTALAVGDFIALFGGKGHDGVGYVTTGYGCQGLLLITAAENWDATHHGTLFAFYTVPLGAVDVVEAVRVQASGGLSIGASVLTSDPGTGGIALGAKISTYNSIATVSNGVPSELATVDLTAQVAAKNTTTLYTPTATGMFRISAILKLTTIGTSPVVGPITITYTDGDGSVAQSIVMLLNSVTGTVVTTTVNNSTTTSTVNGSMVIYAKTGVAIQYAIAQSGTIGAGQWSAHLKCEAL